MPKFTAGSIIGCGINYIRREVFFTFNGEYFGPAFKDIELKEYYATISLHSLSECVTFNFGAKPFKYDIEKMILEEKREGIKSILAQPVNQYALHQIVHSYLNFHGYVNTLEAFEKAAQIERKDVGLPRKEVFKEKEESKEGDGLFKGDDDIEDGEAKSPNLKPMKAESKEIMDIETKKLDDKEEKQHNSRVLDERFRSDSFRVEFESPGVIPLGREHSLDMEPFVLNGDSNSNFNLLRKASIMIDTNSNSNTMINENQPRNGNMAIETKNSKLNDYVINERAAIKSLVLEGKIKETIDALEKLFPGFVQENTRLMKTLHVQQFIELIRANDIIGAIEYSQRYLTAYQMENVYALDAEGKIQEVPIDTLMALLCYPDPQNSELKHFLDLEHRDMTADIVNREILGKMGFLDKSILDILIAHLTQVEERFREQNSHYGEVFEFRV